MEFVDLVIRGQVKLGNVDAEEKEEDEDFFLRILMSLGLWYYPVV